MAQPQPPVDVHNRDVDAALNPPQEQERAPVADLAAAAHPLPDDNVSFPLFVFGFFVFFFHVYCIGLYVDLGCSPCFP